MEHDLLSYSEFIELSEKGETLLSFSDNAVCIDFHLWILHGALRNMNEKEMDMELLFIYIYMGALVCGLCP